LGLEFELWLFSLPSLVMNQLHPDNIGHGGRKAHGQEGQVQDIATLGQSPGSAVNGQGFRFDLNFMGMNGEVRRHSRTHLPVTIGKFHDCAFLNGW
jgi:hypothetical protein